MPLDGHEYLSPCYLLRSKRHHPPHFLVLKDLLEASKILHWAPIRITKNIHELSQSLEKREGGKMKPRIKPRMANTIYIFTYFKVLIVLQIYSSMGTLIKSLCDYQFLKLSKTYLKILFTTINSNFIRMKWLILLDIHPSNSSKASNEIYIAVIIDKASKFFELYIANYSLRNNLQWELAFCFFLSNKPFTESGRWIFSNSNLKHGRYVGHVVFNQATNYDSS